MHTCPMITSGHAAGAATSADRSCRRASRRVLIGGECRRARVGDMCVRVGPPDSIAMGSMKVMIGGKPAARMGDQTCCTAA